MSLLIVRYLTAEGPRWGRLSGTTPTLASDRIEVTPIQTQAATTGALIESLGDLTALADGPTVTIAAAQLLSPVTTDARLLCQGLNYGEHASQSLVHVRKRNLLFMKASSSLSSAYADIVRPAGVRLLDYEVEIGLVLRTDITAATRISEQTLGDYVAGVVLCNDISARDVMFGATFMQWFEGKSYRSFCPAGPVLYLLEPHEVAETLASLELKLWLNGELRQSADSGQMIFKPAETLTQLSALMDLRPGDMLLTGTPGGVIAQPNREILQILEKNFMDDVARQAAMTEEFLSLARFLEPGDLVTASLRDGRLGQDLGSQRSRVTDAPAPV
jgi:2-keto-4-pentenoate hydratase/2-oxohepta-3-ene-1,7-dioic acid hydratase in catechol pathway